MVILFFSTDLSVLDLVSGLGFGLCLDIGFSPEFGFGGLAFGN